MELSQLIRQLGDIHGPSGFEQPIAELAEALLKPYCDSVETDVMGNLLAVRRCGKPGAKKLMLDAHMDEIGLIITGFDKGFLRFDTLGGIDSRMLPAREITILTEPPIRGVIATLPPHILSAEDREKSLDKKTLCIDAGLGEEEAPKLIPLGTPAVYTGSCRFLGERQLCGKAFDDRSCVAILIKVMETLAGKDLPVDLCVSISTQEEVGMRGAKTSAFSFMPDLAVALDVTHGHTPDAKKEETLEMGGGAAVGVGPGLTRSLSSLMIETAKKENIPYQIEVLKGNTGTNSWVIQTTGAGVATALLSLPLKYMHSPVEVIDLRDVQSVHDLLCAFILNVGEVLEA